jgi:hypothetical protein
MFSIPFPYKLLISVALLIGVFFYGYTKGNENGKVALQKEIATRNIKIAELEKKNAEISGKVQIEYIDRVNTIREKEYVYRNLGQNDVPRQHIMSNGWVYTHDISAVSGDADSTRASDASPSGVADNQALLTIISNYANCQATREQLISLQKWIDENKKAVDEQAEKKKK